MPSKTRTTLYATLIGLLPLGATAEQVELSQHQMREMVAAKYVRSTQAVIDEVATRFDGAVMDIRGFLIDEHMTYRLLIQHEHGAVFEVLIDGVTCQLIATNSPTGRAVSSMARSANIIVATQSSKNYAGILSLQ